LSNESLGNLAGVEPGAYASGCSSLLGCSS